MYFSLSYHNLNNLQKAKESYAKVWNSNWNTSSKIRSAIDDIIVTCFCQVYSLWTQTILIWRTLWSNWHVVSFVSKALELEPGSAFYQSSLSQVEEKLRESQQGGVGNTRPAPGGQYVKKTLYCSTYHTNVMGFFVL